MVNKLFFIMLGILLLAIPSFKVRTHAESLQPQESRVGEPGIPAPTLQFTATKSRSDGSFESQVHSTEEFKVLIESSADLQNWSGEGLWEPNTAIVFTNSNGMDASRFYRAVDFTLRVQGTVRDIQTEIPVSQATVTISDLFWETQDIATQTDAQGVFQAVISREFPIRRITVEKAGYDPLVTEPRVDPQTSNSQVSLLLAPSGYRPPNDDFQNRFALEGTNVAVPARTFAATSEPGHTMMILFDDYSESYPRNLWWAWTAPTDGAVLIQRDEAPVRSGSGIVVYTGHALPELVQVWDTSNPANAFFVKQGVQYQICFGTFWPVETGFTLTMVDPVPPVGISAWVGNLLISGSPIRAVGEAFSLMVMADGTSPLRYQWRKDGVNLPDATNTFFLKSDLVLDDAGDYTVLVTNEAGTAISEPIQITVLAERPQWPELLQGTWTMETSQGPLRITFAGLEFTAQWASNNSPAGTGHFQFWETEVPGPYPNYYRLMMTYTEPPEVVRYFRVSLTGPDTGSYEESGPSWYPTVDYDSGRLTRSPQP